MQKKILYWSPHLTNVGTINSVINSAKSLHKFSKNKYKISIINLFGEWSDKNYFTDININLINIFNPKIFKLIPKHSFIKSRFTYLIFFFLSIFRLKKILKENTNSILIIHLLTSLQLIIVKMFNLKIKIVLRISGRIRPNPFRSLIWKICEKKICYITCPSKDTQKDIIKMNIFNKKKVLTLFDPIIETKKINNLKKDKVDDKEIINKKYILAIGRLTKQKNFNQLIYSFKFINKKNPQYNLVILGSGEEQKNLQKIINTLNLKDKIFLIGYKNNVYKYLKNCEVFIFYFFI